MAASSLPMSVSSILLSIFGYGREYQLVTDLTEKVKTADDSSTGRTIRRREDVQYFIADLTKEEIKKEAKLIIDTNKKHHRRFPENGWNNFDMPLTEKAEQFLSKFLVNRDGSSESSESLELEERHYDKIVYLGRCVQFLLDTNAKLRLVDLLDSLETVEKRAHELRETLCHKWFKNQESKEIGFKACGSCDYVDFDEKRCGCGTKISFDYYSINSLDDTSLGVYAEFG